MNIDHPNIRFFVITLNLKSLFSSLVYNRKL